jgi:AraC family transcriptional regulator, transcriptional activator of pobA
MESIPIRYFTPAEQTSDSSEAFSIRDIRDFVAAKSMIQALHRHDFFYILALEKGSGTHEIDFVSFKVRSNSIFFMRPGQVHQLALKAGTAGYLMEFKPEFYRPHDKVSSQLLRKASSMNHYQLKTGRFKKLNSTLNLIFQEYIDKQEGYLEVIKASLGILFIELVRHHHQNVTSHVKAYPQERLEEFLELLEKNVLDMKQASQYADRLNLSLYQLNAITKTALGKTCSELIIEYIILESKRLLLATSSQVSQIAHQLGYDDISYFIRFFKKHTGHSPEAFRNNFR